MNLGGRSVPVIDLAERLGLTNATPYTPATPVLLCADGERRAGLVVSDIMGVATVEQHDLQMDSEFKGAKSLFLGSATAVPFYSAVDTWNFFGRRGIIHLGSIRHDGLTGPRGGVILARARDEEAGI